MRKLTTEEIDQAAEEYSKKFKMEGMSAQFADKTILLLLIKTIYLQGMMKCQELQEQPLTNPPK